ncbi:aldehyde dehydrogenase family protein [Mesorhizobium sp.]|uniref:aldehyde dehydrogenase family protein n=1 Tax=Mesorhizobium sp. TaxID=1871066 RepID=UPI000FE7578D|nr:aldehyde dehydrogenase family protein [Mesorhizobium sp.]RWI16721.1 MAG: aldehyde dehydrogenase family protein [Mesorhizobium sp.]RWN08790.1 MAG: aldehyde dehydrogenase family protein [Mesorhizobium sp.]RWN16215.1 MAG: aldehyde dehydrogenase family protein [Mesorhizobium sp.]TIQ97483.1 MAG: aldehyde dehydrogenase family protein [Mesorhizobium sp.]
MSAATQYELFIDGAWRRGGNGEIPVVNPATEQVFASVASASIEDLDDALAAAERSRGAWAALPACERGALLIAAARILASRVDEAARSLSGEQGKTLAEAKGEYRRALEMLEWNGIHAEQLCASLPIGAGRTLVPEPLGVIAAFTPWNYPAVLNARKLGAALVAGCPVILKGAEETPSASVFLVQALQDAGIPAGVVNLVFGVPAVISEHLLRSPVIKVLSFTGSTAVGKHLARLAADNLQRCVLELGGHCPVIVCEDADVEAAAAAISEYKFECAGQSCNAPSRVLVAKPVYEQFVSKLVDVAKSIKVGAPDAPDTQMGPLANGRRIDALKRLTEDAVAKGANIETGGRRLDQAGFYWPPTILTGVRHDSSVLREEPFGPILTVAPFESLDDAIAEANDTEYGLASYCFTASEETKRTLAGSLTAGAVSINFLRGVAADAPHSGVKQSGYGYEGGEQGVRSFQNLKLINGLDALDR